MAGALAAEQRHAAPNDPELRREIVNPTELYYQKMLTLICASSKHSKIYLYKFRQLNRSENPLDILISYILISKYG